MCKKIIKRIGSICLIGSMLLSIFACGKEEAVVIDPMEKEEVYSLSLDFLGEDVMPISGFYGPYNTDQSVDGDSAPYYFSDEIMSLIAECGINNIHYTMLSYSDTPDQVTDLLNLGEKYNVGIFVQDWRINSPKPDKVASVEEITERLNLYENHPAFCGVYVIDEPGSTEYLPSEGKKRDISTYAPLFKNLREVGVIGSGNLFPVWAFKSREDYEGYLEEYCSTCDPYYLSWDYYVWDKKENKVDYFYSLDTGLYYANKYEIPVWTYIQAGGQWNDAKNHFDSEELYPTEGQMRWNINTSLAYGVKGLEIFPTIQPYYFAYAQSKELDVQRNGIIGAWGNKTQWWYYLNNITSHIAAIDNVLMNSVNKGVLVSGENAKNDLKDLRYVIDGDSWREIKSVEGNALIGCFNYQGKTALYVVNYEESYAQKVTLNLHNAYKMSVTQQAKESKVETQNLVLDLQPGEGVLVVFD